MFHRSSPVRPTVTVMSPRTLLAAFTAGPAAATCLVAAGPANAGQGHACSASVSPDRFSDAVDKTTYDGTFVGNLSALARSRSGGGTPAGTLTALSDRSALFRLDARTLRPTHLRQRTFARRSLPNPRPWR